MSFNYNKLWKLLIDRNMNKSDLKELTHINSNTLAKLGKDQYVSMEILDRICKELECDINDIVEHVSEQKN